jgi:hypothetical protein
LQRELSFFWNKKMTEGFLQNHIKSTLQSLRVAYGNPPPFTREAEIVAIRNPQKLVATASRREGVYNRTGEPSVIFAEEEELHSE